MQLTNKYLFLHAAIAVVYNCTHLRSRKIKIIGEIKTRSAAERIH